MGGAICRRFAASGARIVALDLHLPALRELVRELGPDICEIVRCDVTREADCRRAIGRARKRFGKIDVLINNAGISHRSEFRKTDPIVLKKVMEVSYFGSVYCTFHAIDALIESNGSIIALSSPAGFGPLVARTGYSAAKHALHGLFDSLRTELGSEVHVMLVCPAFTRTSIGTNSLDEKGNPIGQSQRSVGDFLEPEFVAERIFRGWQDDRELVLVGKTAWLGYYLNRFAPRLYRRIMLRSLRQELQTRMLE